MSKIINEAPLDVKPYILESWKRCEEQGLDKNNGTGSTVDKKEFREILRQNTDLIAYGKPIIENLYDIIVNSDTILYIMDTDCVILALVGDEKIIERVKKEANLKVGSKWSEETIGTNAADLCMRLNKPIQTIGRDHYCISHYEATCCAAPIHNPEGRILGALVTTSMMDKVSQHSLGLVLAGTRLIENEAARFKISKLTEAGFNAIEEGMFITDGYYTVRRCNAAALEILGIGKEDLIGCDARTLFKDITFGKETLSIKNRSIIFKVNHREKPCFGSINSLKFNEVNMGIVVVFKRERQVNKMANRIMGNTASFTFDDILSKSEVMQGVINEAKKISGVNCSVLITGESGTGKELFAQSIHNASKRRSKPFIAINCAAIPSNLVESEIFGYEEGSFTGAKKNGKPGKFELADEGTLFLDEIGELPLDIQSKLLRVLDNHKVMRIGSNQEKMIDVRVIAATNRNLAEEVEKHNFRLDLLYRINTLTIKIP
ncbi:MAG: sigma 54-interacting transcriptional regulator, partial [Eubacterium sp.]